MGMFGSLFGGGGAAPAPANAAPAPAVPSGDPTWSPGKLDTLWQMLWGDQSPADAASHLRDLHYTNAMRPAQMNAAQNFFGLFGGGAPQGQPAPPPANDAPPTTPDEMFGRGISNAIGPFSSAPSPAPAPAQPSPSGGLDVSDPRIQRALLGAAMFKIPGSTEALDMAKAVQPNVAYDRGYGYNTKTGKSMGGFHPDLEKDQVPVFDANGNFAGVRNADGSTQAVSAMAGAKASGEAPWTLVDVPQSDGSTVKMPLSVAAPLLARNLGAGGGGAPGAPPAGGAPTAPAGNNGTQQLGVTQSPAAATLANSRATTQGDREKLQPQQEVALSDLDNRSNLTSQIIHQILGDAQDPKTGQWKPGGKPMINWATAGAAANLKNIDGTPAHNLEAQLDHIRAMTALDELEKLRESSPTGAGLGRTTQSEIDLLASMRGSIDQGQDGKQLTQNLRRQLDQLDMIRGNRHTLYQKTYGNIQQPTPGATAPIPPGQGQGQGQGQAPSRAALMAEARRRGLVK